MQHELDLILTLAGALTAALVFGLVAQKLRLSPIVGYLFAGVAIGPFTPGYVAHGAIAREFAELGVVLLMFGVGLNLHLRELLAVKRLVVPGAILGMVAAFSAGFVLGKTLGWSTGAAEFFGLAIAVTSTVVLLRVLTDEDQLHTRIGHVATGWLLVEDLFVVLIVVVAPIASTTHGASFADLATAAGVSAAKIAALIALILVPGRVAVPRLLALIARTRSRELFTLAVLVMSIGVAAVAAKLFGSSLALGAFLAGLVIGQSEFAARTASEALPMRDAFAVLFFVATGMLLDPSHVIAHLPLIIATLVILWTVKPTVALVVLLLARQPFASALTLAFGLGQIGEFSFVLSVLGRDLRVLPDAAVQSLVATSILAITFNPFFVKLAQPIARALTARTVAPAREEDVREAAPDAHYRAVLIGYGPVGRSLARLLREFGVRPTVVEMNHEVLDELRRDKIEFVYGDASRPDILERAGVRNAASFVFTASGPSDAAIHAAKDLNPRLRILVRAAYMHETARLLRAGATDVVSAESEVALAMAERLLVRLGASGEELDRARDRVRRDVDVSRSVGRESRTSQD